MLVVWEGFWRCLGVVCKSFRSVISHVWHSAFAVYDRGYRDPYMHKFLKPSG